MGAPTPRGGSRGAWARRPEHLFLIVSLVFGLLFVAVVPPLGGGNETFNFPRTVAIAYGEWLVGDATVPAGLSQLTAAADAHFPEGAQAPYGFSGDAWRELAVIPLQRDVMATAPASPIAVLNPVSYLPQAALVRLGAFFDASPLTLFYVSRLTGLACAIALTFAAIRIAPSRKFAWCALALLPPVTFARSTIDADQITVALAFLFIAMTLSQIAAPGRARTGGLAWLALAAFLTAQCKSAYFVLPLLCLAIPTPRFGSAGRRAVWLILLTIPGACASLGYMLALRLTYFAHIQYATWAGAADPSRQLDFVLAHPLGFALVLARTVFATPLLLDSVRDLAGVFGPPMILQPVIWLSLVALAGLIVVADPTARDAVYGRATRWLCAAIFIAAGAIVLALLYLQWNGLGALSVKGFQGRYLCPVLPLLLAFAPASRRLAGATSPVLLTTLLAVGGLSSALILTARTYFG